MRANTKRVRRLVVMFFSVTALLLLYSALTLAATQYEKVGRVTKATLDNGIRVLVNENDANSVVAVYLYLDGGSAYDPSGKVGLTTVMQSLITKGTATRSALQIARETEGVGANLGSISGTDSAGVYCVSTVQALPKALEVFFDIVSNPNFPPDELEKERVRTVQAIAGSTDDPFQATVLGYMASLYGDHPYGRPSVGIAEDVASISREDLLDWKRRVYNPEKMIISVVGRVKAEEMAAAVEKSLGHLAPVADPLPSLASPLAPPAPVERVLTRQAMAAFIALGFPAPAYAEKDKAAMDVLNNILGGGMSSRLFVDLRDTQGLAYFVQSAYIASDKGGTILALMATSPQALDISHAAILAEFRRLAEEPVGTQELESAKAYTLGTRVMSLETNLGKGADIAVGELYSPGRDVGLEYIESVRKVTAEDVQRLAKSYFTTPTSFTVVPQQ